ncbi:MAG TPA: lactonase family protein [Chloroflexota bacterium]|nr:lactonase family protein [Chloroflexota bacterium]
MGDRSAWDMLLFVGTFTALPPHPRGRAQGIDVFQLDLSTGTLLRVRTVMGVPNPSFLALHPSRRFLYAVNAVPEIDDHDGGALSAFAIDWSAGDLIFLNRQSTRGAGPCHVSVDQSGQFAFAANYGGGSVAVFPIRDDGRLDPASDFIQHTGASVDPERQRGPHAHSINLTPDGRFALVADLGIDRLLVYRIDRERGRLIPNDPPFISVSPGSGPRHLDFHPTGLYLYLINEIGSTVTVLAYDGDRGTAREVQTISTLPEGFSGPNTCADIHVHPSGRFVYGSNRGHDSIVIYAVDKATGRLAQIGHQPTLGRTPRNFLITSEGTWLLAANQDSDTIVTFRIDTQTGLLTPVGQPIESLSPVCLRIATPP